ncbi:MAG: transcriptional repressor LexA [Anaerolineae bacterium]
MTQLDEHGARIIAFIEHYLAQHHHSPSYREIGAAVGIASKDHVSRDLEQLEQQGYLRRTPRVGRSIVLLRNARGRRGYVAHAIPLPIAGVIKTRQPITAPTPQTPPIDWATVGRELIDDEGDVVVLRVDGDTMIDALVHDGDLVVIKPQRIARSGEMIAVWVKPIQRLCLKYYYPENGHIRLQPANPELQAMHVHPSEIEIQGQVLAVMRKAM